MNDTDERILKNVLGIAIAGTEDGVNDPEHRRSHRVEQAANRKGVPFACGGRERAQGINDGNRGVVGPHASSVANTVVSLCSKANPG